MKITLAAAASVGPGVRRRVLPVFRVPVALVLLAGLGIWIVPPRQLAAAAATADPAWGWPVLALLPVGLAIQWWKWRVLVRSGLPGTDERSVVASLLTGFGLGFITPGRLGELGRGLALPGRRRAATVLATADRALSAAVTLALGGTMGAVLVFGVPAAGLVGAGCVGLTIVLAAWWCRRTGAGPGHGLGGVAAPAWGANAAGALVFNLVFWLQFYCLLRAAGAVPAAAAAAIPAVFALKTLLPISFMDLGVREGAAAFVLVPLGVSAAAAVQAALGLCLVNVLLPGAAGLLYLGLGGARHCTWTSLPRAFLAHVR